MVIRINKLHSFGNMVNYYKTQVIGYFSHSLLYLKLLVKDYFFIKLIHTIESC